MIRESISLNFINFSWGLAQSKQSNVFASGVSLVIALFPALDTLSIFPLIANTLGNSMHAAFPESRNFVRSYLGEGATPKSVYGWTTIMWRLIAAIPPIFLSAFITNLSLSLQLAGVCGIIVSLIIPALLQRYSKQQLQCIKSISSSFLLAENPYSSIFSDNMYTSVVLAIALIVLAICLCQVFTII